MNLRPVIEREMRVAARQRVTYLNRATPGLLFLIIIGIFLLESGSRPQPQQGQALFAALNTVLYGLIWLVVPLSTSDCLSREKREDTLGLLLLTPLRPVELVVSKLFSGFWQSSMLVLAIVPMLTIPLLMGGVSLLDVLHGILSLLTALFSAVTVGILASAWCERRGRAWLLVVFVGALWLAVQLSVHGILLLLEHIWRTNSSPWNPDELIQVWYVPAAIGWFMQSGMGSVLSQSEFGVTGVRLALSALMLAGTLAVCWLGLLLAAYRVRRFNESRYLTARGERLQAAFVGERIAKKRLQNRRRRWLDRNPIVWLQNRRWSHRLTKWGWLLAASAVVSVGTFDPGWGFAETAMVTSAWLGVFMLFSLVLVTSSSLQAERDNGALELILVTPLTPKAFAGGRIRSFWITYLPAAIVTAIPFWFHALLSLQMSWYRVSHYYWFFAPMIAATAFFALLLWLLPAIGLCFSLNRPGLLAAGMNTLFFGVVVPWGLPLALFVCGAVPQRLLEETPQFRPIPLWTVVGVWAGLTAGFQFAIWRAGRRTDARPFPRLMPEWYRRRRLGWILPWAVPLLCFGFFELVPLEVLHQLPESDYWLFTLWNLSAWGLLWFIGHRCRLALIEMLAQRQFGPVTAANN